MNNTIFLKTNRVGFSPKDWVYNVLVEADRIVYRALIPSQEFVERNNPFTVSSIIGKDQLLKTELLFKGLVCNFNANSLVQVSLDDKDYFVIYETILTLEDLKAAGTWHNGAICSIYVPVLNRIWTQPGFYSDAVTECWHRDSAHGESMTSHEAKYRRLHRVEALAHFSVISDNATLTDSDVVLCLPENTEIISNVQYTPYPENYDITDLMVDYTVEHPNSITAESLIEISVKALLKGYHEPVNKVINLKMINGYAPKTIINLVDGVGHFKVRALDLNPGEKLKFQLQDYGRTCVEVEIPVV